MTSFDFYPPFNLYHSNCETKWGVVFSLPARCARDVHPALLRPQRAIATFTSKWETESNSVGSGALWHLLAGSHLCSVTVCCFYTKLEWPSPVQLCSILTIVDNLFRPTEEKGQIQKWWNEHKIQECSRKIFQVSNGMRECQYVRVAVVVVW